MAAMLVGGLVAPLAAGLTAGTASAEQTQERRTPWVYVKKTDQGYLYRAGVQNSRIAITKVRGGLRMVDTRAVVLESLPRSCHRVPVRDGVGVVCSVPGSVGPRRPLTVDVVTGLGNDVIDSSALSRSFRLEVLADVGHDTVRLGAGADFVNGAKGVDRVRGGPGADWIRTGMGDDVLRGGAGRDRLVGTEGSDVLHGGAGDDRVEGGMHGDRLSGDAGADVISCSSGHDRAVVDGADTRRGCESVSRR